MSSLPHSVININERLRLVQLQPNQADRVFGLVDSNREYLGRFLPWVEKTKTVDDSRNFINLMLQRRASGDEYGYGIEHDGEIVGHTSLMHLKDKQVPEIGYWIGADYQGNGIITSTTNTLTKFAFDTLGFSSVIIRAEPSNAASNRVAEKCGYHRDGEIQEDAKVLNIWKKSRK